MRDVARFPYVLVEGADLDNGPLDPVAISVCSGLSAMCAASWPASVWRDGVDTERAVAPLRPASDATVIDTDEFTLEEVVDTIVKHMGEDRKGR